MLIFIIFFSLVLKSSGEWIVGDTLSSKDQSEVYKSKRFQHRPQLEEREWALLEYQREQEKKLLQNIQELQDLNAEILEHMDAKQYNEQGLRKWSKAFVDELQEKKKEMKEQYQQQLKEIEEKNLELTLSKEKGSDLQFELQKKQEEFAEKEKEFSELHQLKKEELANIEHQLKKKEQKIQEYSHLLQVNKKELEECQDALRTQKLKNESQSIQLLHHSPQGMYCI